MSRTGTLLFVTVTAAMAAPLTRASQSTEARISVGGASLYARVLGSGPPVIVLHGGPDFDHSYLLPDLDRLADTFRLIYYDQRGRGRSAENVRPADVTIASEVSDLDAVREHFGLEAPALLGHSWGAVLALEYALRHPSHVSRIILMNPAPVSTADAAVMRKAYVEKLGPEMERQLEIVRSAAYQEGDPEAVTARYRIHFKPALKRREDYERLLVTLHSAFTRQGKDGIVKARAVEEHLMLDTWGVSGYDLLPRLRNVQVPVLVLTGDADFIPVEIGSRIARATPRGKLVTIHDCGHFAYLECAADAREALEDFFGVTKR